MIKQPANDGHPERHTGTGRVTANPLLQKTAELAAAEGTTLLHISVCIITYKRPSLLKRLLLALQRQNTADLFTYSVVVVDNDHHQSARVVVEEVGNASIIAIAYTCEPQQNLALARNRAIRSASGEFVAFIDDDEFPDEHWLHNLYRTWQEHHVAGVLAPVVPHFEELPPAWIIKSGIFERPRYKTGYVLHWDQTRTGNVLLDKRVLELDADLFDPYFATHGEDRDFFKRLMAKGHTFVWCDSAAVYETQPRARLCRRYHIRRALLRGSIAYTHTPEKMRGVLTSIVAVPLYTVALPFLQMSGHHRFMKYFVKTCDHVGRLLASCGYRVEQHMKLL
jgi:glycosyltransferase involved in cell wall biosynthesis